tara:strand:- start:420 stop:956 length:537 start_codon:yes stop_codon:yes gene_type:complete
MYEEQVMQPQQTTEISSSPKYEVNETIHKWLYSSDDVLLETEKKFRGVVWDRKTRSWIQTRKPMMNDDGINFFLSQLGIYTSKLVILSNLREDKIKSMTLDYGEEVIPVLGMNAEKFDIEEASLGIIRQILENTFYFTLRRAKDGEGLGLIRDTQKSIETVAPKSKSFKDFRFFSSKK